MSFSIEFVARDAEDADAIMAQEQYVPQTVKDFVRQALKAAKGPVLVKAHGHLFNNDYDVSSATIEVRPLGFRKPKAA